MSPETPTPNQPQNPTPNPLKSRLSPNRKKNPNQPQNQPQTLPAEENTVSVEVDAPAAPAQKSGFSDFLKSVTAQAKETPAEKPAKKKQDTKGETEDVSDVIALLVALVFSGLALPDEAKPNSGEIDALSYHTSRIFLRHIDPAKQINADMLDAVGILSVCAGWFIRTKDYRTPEKKNTLEAKGYTEPAPEKPAPVSADMIEDDASAAFLARSATKAEGRN